ncbi:MAG TPA: hypothetical protein VFL36_20170 [Myxococcales bacterium]|nr:hypothetical protein [Myxococcales bacterium]
MRVSSAVRAALLASTVLIACGGGGGGGGGSAGDGPAVPPDYTGLSTVNLPASKLLDVPLRWGYGAFCYIQSMSMSLAYLDPSSTEAEVFTYTGFGAPISYAAPYGSAPRGFVPAPPGTFLAVETLLANHGARHVIGTGGGFGSGFWKDAGAGSSARRWAGSASGPPTTPSSR